MGIFDRLNRVIKSNVNQLIDTMSDPAKEIDLLIIEMEEGLKDAKEEVIAATATAKRTGIRARGLEEDVEKWNDRAGQAVRAGEDDLAREALSRRMAVDREFATAKQAELEQIGHANGLKQQLKDLEQRLKEVKLRKETLKGRARAAKEGTSGLSGAKAFKEFDRLEDKIEAMETTSEITADLDTRDAALNAKFDQLEAKDPGIEDELAALKRRLESGE